MARELSLFMLALLTATILGAGAALALASGPASMLGATQEAVRDLISGTSPTSAEDRRTRLEEAIRRSAERERIATPDDPSRPPATALAVQPVGASTPSPIAVRSTPSATPTLSPTPDERARLRYIIGQALTSYTELPPDWAANVEVTAKILNDMTVPAGETISFTEVLGPVAADRGFRLDLPSSLLWGDENTSCVAGGVCQVSSTLLQAAFVAGLQIVEHHNFPAWYPAFGAGPDRRPGLDARVGPGADLKIRNNSPDAIRIEAWADGRTAGVVIYGVDPTWAVERGEPQVGGRQAAPRTTERREVRTLPAGRDYTIAQPSEGFSVEVTRNVIREGQVVDRYQRTVRYRPMPGVRLIGVLGATPTPTHTPTPAQSAPTPTGFDPAAFRVDGGRVRVPPLVGLPEAEARRRIEAVGLTNTFTNYQGRGDVPDAALRTVPVGHVLSHTPPADTVVNAGETIYIAVRRE